MDALESFDPRSLTPPAPSPEWLEPPGCAGLLESDSSLLLIEAGPGFGKTALLAEIHCHAVARGDAAVWLDLAGAPLSGVQLVKRVLLGFARGPLGGRSTALALALTEPDIPPSVLLQVLLAEVDAQDRPCVLFLDGAQLSVDASPNFSACDVIRTLALRPSSRFRLQISGSLAVIDHVHGPGLSADGYRCLLASDLRLEREQVGTLLRRHVPEAIDAELPDLIHEQIRGWPAGVMLAIEALRRTRSHHVTDRFLRTWRGELARYFDTRMLASATQDEREYLRHASQFRIFTAGLLTSGMSPATAFNVSHAVLAAKGALLEPLEPAASNRGGSRQSVLSCYPAFRRYLEDRFLDTLTPEQRRRGQREAIVLLQELGFHADAVDSLLDLGEPEAAAALIEEHCEAILERTDVGRIRGWRERLDESHLGPLALLTLAWAELLVSDVAEAEQLIDAARQRTAGRAPPIAVAAHLLVLELGVAALSDDLAQVIERIDLWQREFAGHDSTWLAHHMSNARSYVAMHAGEQIPAAWLAHGSWRSGDEVDLPRVVRHCYQAKTSLLAGRFDAVRSEISRAEELADLLPDRMAGARYLPLTVEGLLAWEQGDLGMIYARLEPRMSEILASTLIAHRHDAVTAVARARSARGDFASALQLLEEAKAGPGARMPNRFALELDREQLRILCFQGQAGLAGQLLAAMRGKAEGAVQTADQYQSLARILLSSDGLVAYATDEYQQAYVCLSELLQALGARGAVGRYPALQAMGLMIAILWQLGRRHEALEQMGRLLPIARTAGMRQTFLDWRTVIDEPLAAFVDERSGDPAAAYALSLLERKGEPAEQDASLAAEDGLLDLLSKREWQVLSLAANGLSTKAIAKQLSISPNTVKWHLKNGYEKTGVRNRAEASRLFVSR